MLSQIALKFVPIIESGPRQDLKLRRRIKSERIDDETTVDYDSVTMRNKSERIDDETSHSRLRVALIVG